MDEKTRGRIEQRFEDELLGFIENEDVRYVLDTVPISSKKDFLSGFVVAKLTYIAWTYLPDATDGDLQEVREIIRRRLPEIQTKILKELNI